MKVKFLRDIGFCKTGKIVDLPEEQAAKLLEEKSVEVFNPPKPKKLTKTTKGDE